MLFASIVQTSRTVANTRSRLDKVRHLSACLSGLSVDEIDIGVSYLAGRLRQGNVGIGAALLDAASAAASVPQPSLSLGQVDRVFEDIARTMGTGSVKERRGLLHTLYAQATADEQRFLAGLGRGELRQGALEGIMVEAIARAAGVPASEVRRAVMVAGDVSIVAKAALTEGAQGLTLFTLTILQPIQPMLAQPADDVTDALGQLQEAAFEYKMDGARVQVHKREDEVRVFTRTLHDVSASVPEIVEAVQRLPAHALVLDGEALAFCPDGIPHPFQVTMRRFGRKLDVGTIRETLPLTPFFFDCLHAEGQDLIDRPGQERYGALRTIIPEQMVTPRLVTEDRAGADTFLQEALSRGHEGVMAKSLHAAYEAGRRGSAWLKIKRAHTLDLVVLAAEWGHGRRQGWLSNLHLGARDPHKSGFVMLGKTFKGMTDEMLAWQTRTFKELEIGCDAYTLYVRPEIVVEIAFNDIQASPHYPGGLACVLLG